MVCSSLLFCSQSGLFAWNEYFSAGSINHQLAVHVSTFSRFNLFNDFP